MQKAGAVLLKLGLDTGVGSGGNYEIKEIKILFIAEERRRKRRAFQGTGNSLSVPL
jgi:hypothetical protein